MGRNDTLSSSKIIKHEQQLSLFSSFENNSNIKSINENPLDKGPELRDYQRKIVISTLKRLNNERDLSTLVVLPTGTGKTRIAEIIAVDRLRYGRELFIAHTGTLVVQQLKSFKNDLNLSDGDIVGIIGNKTKPNERSLIYKRNPKIIIGTSQAIARDLSTNRLNLQGFSLLISDESHYSTGMHTHLKVA